MDKRVKRYCWFRFYVPKYKGNVLTYFTRYWEIHRFYDLFFRRGFLYWFYQSPHNQYAILLRILSSIDAIRIRNMGTHISSSSQTISACIYTHHGVDSQSLRSVPAKVHKLICWFCIFPLWLRASMPGHYLANPWFPIVTVSILYWSWGEQPREILFLTY